MDWEQWFVALKAMGDRGEIGKRATALKSENQEIKKSRNQVSFKDCIKTMRNDAFKAASKLFLELPLLSPGRK